MLASNVRAVGKGPCIDVNWKKKDICVPDGELNMYTSDPVFVIGSHYNWCTGQDLINLE